MSVYRHFAFFSRSDGTYLREWAGPVDTPPLGVSQRRIDLWATRVSKPGAGEIGLDVTHLGWPVGDFCYCRLDVAHGAKPLLDWGPPRHYIEVDLATGDIVAHVESHRPVRDSVHGQHVIDLTGTPLEALWARFWGRLVRRHGRMTLEPYGDSRDVPTGAQAHTRVLAAAHADLGLFGIPSLVAQPRGPSSLVG